MIRFGSYALCSALAVASHLALPSVARADIQEENILLIYNENNDVSYAIAMHYIYVHPNVQVLNLDMECEDPVDPANPGTYAANAFCITPQAFYEWVWTPVQDYIAGLDPEDPPVLAIATTRGLPACVATHFAAPAEHETVMVKSSLEWALSGLPITHSQPYFRALGIGIEEFYEEGLGECVPPPERIMPVSRLDSDVADSSTADDEDYIDAVVALIDRSVGLSVNKITTTLVYDTCATCAGNNWTFAGISDWMYDRSWSVKHDATSDFMHGVYSPANSHPGWNSGVEGAYTGKPELVHQTTGRNQIGDTDGVSIFYVRDFQPHEAGMFMSVESYNGITARNPHLMEGTTSPEWRQGMVLDWIYSGGSFAIGHVQGITGNAPYADFAVANLYHHGLTWAEAAWSSIDGTAPAVTVIGDPLARVHVYTTDVNGDGVVNGGDLGAFMATWGYTSGPTDFDGNGIVDGGDLGKLMASWGASRLADPDAGDDTWPDPPSEVHNCHTGDVNGDGHIGIEDIEDWLEESGDPCVLLDVNGDGLEDSEDIAAIICRWGVLLGDVNGDGIVNGADTGAVLGQWSVCTGDCSGDLVGDCYGPDGVVDVRDWMFVLNHWGNTFEDVGLPPDSGELELVLGLATISLTYADCDGDFIPDGCACEHGWVKDANNNGIPDHCE